MSEVQLLQEAPEPGSKPAVLAGVSQVKKVVMSVNKDPPAAPSRFLVRVGQSADVTLCFCPPDVVFML